MTKASLAIHTGLDFVTCSHDFTLYIGCQWESALSEDAPRDQWAQYETARRTIDDTLKTFATELTSARSKISSSREDKGYDPCAEADSFHELIREFATTLEKRHSEVDIRTQQVHYPSEGEYDMYKRLELRISSDILSEGATGDRWEEAVNAVLANRATETATSQRATESDRAES
jgi:uncharacterized protein (DUF4415 family)